jgi:hypothetical protein
MSLARLFGSWRAERTRDARASRYVAAMMQEPPDDVVDVVARLGDADRDHAQWELRYARRAIGLLIAQRDALDDLTASDVAAALDVAQATDPRIGSDRRVIADRQFNDRVRAYRTALADRATTTPTAERLGRVLVTFAGATPDNAAAQQIGAELAGNLVTECNAALREAYGEASLPEDIRPSEI